MTRKDYIIIAEALRVTYRREQIGEEGSQPYASNAVILAACEIADSLQRDNARFNRGHFLAVVKGEKELLSRPARGAKCSCYGRCHEGEICRVRESLKKVGAK
jgi:hypothetical protein